MIAAWMVYCVGVALAFVVVGEALARALHWTRCATRWAWAAALAGSCLVPAAAWLRPDAFGALQIPLARPIAMGPSPTVGPSDAQFAGAGLPTPTLRFSLADLDGVLLWGWPLTSTALLLVLLAAALRLATWRRRWRPASVDGRAVLVSASVGPAVAGLWRPRIVVPAWTLELGEEERRLMLAHEEEHIRAGDPWVLAAGAMVLVLTPWNPALWWQVRQLRLAVEMDCDARVLARSGDAPAYGELLLRVGRRRARPPLGAPALGEPASFLERRIRRLVTQLPRWRWAGAMLGIGVAAAAMVAACEAPRPVPQRSAENVAVPWDSGQSVLARTLLRQYFGPDPSRLADSSVIVWFVLDQRGTVAGRGTLPQTQEDTVLYALELARRIPGYDTLSVGKVELLAERRLPPTIIVWRKRAGAPPGAQASGKLDAADLRELARRADYVRETAHRYHPEVFARPRRPGAAIALVFDPQDRVIGHAAGVREARDADCLAVVKRLVPEFAAVQPSRSGCADAAESGHRGEVVVYWMSLLRAPASERLRGTASR